MVTHVRRALFVGLVILSAAVRAGASPITLNFDDLLAVSDNLQSSSICSSPDVFMSTLNSIHDSVDSRGGAFVASVLSNTFWLIRNDNSISPEDFTAAHQWRFNEVLMFFAIPVTSVDCQTDSAVGENADVVRLLAVKRLTVFNFEVLAADSELNKAVAVPNNTLHVDLRGTPFSHTVFRTTTEQEGIDNLWFNRLPEPASLWLVGSGSVMLVRRRRESRWSPSRTPSRRCAMDPSAVIHFCRPSVRQHHLCARRASTWSFPTFHMASRERI